MNTNQFGKYQTLRGIIVSICALALIICFSIQSVSFSNDFYFVEGKKQNTKEQLNVNNDAYVRVIYNITSYLKGTNPTFQQREKVNGEMVDLYTPTEVNHMKDVRAIYAVIEIITWVAGALFIGLIAYQIIKYGRKSLRRYGLIGLISIGATILIVGGILVYALLNYDKASTDFHLLMFNNDDWLLSPDMNLIKIVTESFLKQAIYKIWFMMSILSVIYLIINSSFLKLSRNKDYYEDDSDYIYQ